MPTKSQKERYGLKLVNEVYQKSDYKCSVCGEKESLSIHHIDGSGNSKNPNNSLKNLILMCKWCHAAHHMSIRLKKIYVHFTKKGWAGDVKFFERERSRERRNTEQWQNYQKEYHKKYKTINQAKLRKHRRDYYWRHREKILAECKLKYLSVKS